MCPVYVLCMSCVCPVYVLCICPVYVLCMSCVCPVYVLCMSCVCPVYVLYMYCICSIYVLYMSCICPVYVLYMSSTCMSCIYLTCMLIYQQLGEACALAGSRGLYLLETADIGDEYMYEFASFLKCILHMQSKGTAFDKLDTKRLHEKLVKTQAKLEVMMPVHWNTITRNLLLLHPGWLDEFGAFWATNMLSVESLHVLIKSLCRNRNHMMASFLYHYDIFSTSQLTWRFDTEFCNDPRPSSLCWKDTVEERRTEVHVLGTCISRPVFVLYMSCICHVYVLYMSCICPVYVLYMSCICPSCICPVYVLYINMQGLKKE